MHTSIRVGFIFFSKYQMNMSNWYWNITVKSALPLLLMFCSRIVYCTFKWMYKIAVFWCFSWFSITIVRWVSTYKYGFAHAVCHTYFERPCHKNWWFYNSTEFQKYHRIVCIFKMKQKPMKKLPQPIVSVYVCVCVDGMHM